MNDTVKERLKLFLKKNGIKAVDFCNSIGVSSGFISGMRESIQPDKLKSIAINYPLLNITWLMTGLGNMLNEQNEIELTFHNNAPRTIFHYTTLKNFANILLSNSFIPSSFWKANDYKEKVALRDINRYKYISFVSDQIELYSCTNPVMWNYYANAGNGVCIEFDRERLIQLAIPLLEGYINYRNGVTHIDIQNDLEYLMEKRLDWSYEHEYRFIYDNQVECICNIVDCIKGVYFGYNVPNMVIERFASYAPIYDLYMKKKIIFYRIDPDSWDGRLSRLEVLGYNWALSVKNENVEIEWFLCGMGEVRRTESSRIIEELKAEINQLKGENRVLREQIGLGERKDSDNQSA